MTTALPHEEAAKTFADWLSAGRHADMTWLEKTPARRTRPDMHVPDACSVLMLAVNYYRDTPSPDMPGSGRIARYAAGEDYHRVIDAGLKGLCRDLKNRFPETGARFYVDYGPVLERAFAERAGLGFIGKSANLIHPAYGTYVFLATIITNLRLPVHNPAPGTCGECRRCIDVCPTGALTGPFEIDAALCISYLTIENRGPIPRRLRPLIGNWLFGCDLCQEVCPYNARAQTGANPAIARTTIAGTSLDVAEVLGIRADEAFSRRFSRSPLRRAKRAGLLRNAAVVAGNSGNSDLVDPLISALGDPSPLVRGHAVWALDNLGEPQSALDALREETDPFVASELSAIVERTGDS